jgi:hypothetical protein
MAAEMQYWHVCYDYGRSGWTHDWSPVHYDLVYHLCRVAATVATPKPTHFCCQAENRYNIIKADTNKQNII